MMKNFFLMKILKIILINFTLILIFVLFLELLIFTINKDKIKCSYVLCNYDITYDNNLYKPFNEINYKKDAYGFRGRYKDVSEIDILVFGGSTTDERYLNINDTWTEKLESLLEKKSNIKIDVVNAGIDGQSTFGHIWNFKNWINYIENFKTKYIFFYIGINDGEQAGYFDLNEKSNINFKQKIKLFIKNNNAFIYNIYKSYLILKIKLNLEINPGHNKLEMENINYEIVDKKNLYKNDNFTKIYIKNLEKLTKLSREIGAEPIFVTQRSFKWFKKDNQIYSIKNSYDNELQKKSIIIKYCKDNNLFCIDLFEKLEIKKVDTYDLVHLTPRGSSKVAKIISKEILNSDFFSEKLKIQKIK